MINVDFKGKIGQKHKERRDGWFDMKHHWMTPCSALPHFMTKGKERYKEFHVKKVFAGSISEI